MDFGDLESIEEVIKSGIFGQIFEETINQAASLEDLYFYEGKFDIDDENKYIKLRILQQKYV